MNFITKGTGGISMRSRVNSETLSTVHRTFKLINALREMEGARVTELAEKLEVALSTAHKYLATLEAEECVVKEGDQYHVGLEFLNIGTDAKYSKEEYHLSADKTSGSPRILANVSSSSLKNVDKVSISTRRGPMRTQS